MYAGRVVDGSRAALQNDGSVVMGSAPRLYEAIEFADGQVANANLGDYHVPAVGDMPGPHAD